MDKNHDKKIDQKPPKCSAKPCKSFFRMFNKSWQSSTKKLNRSIVVFHWFLVSSALVQGCGTKSDDDQTSIPPSVTEIGEIKDTSLNGLISFLKAGTYLTWTKEAAVHDSQGPHGKVRSYFNPTLTESLKAKNTTHTVGSIAVKELYGSDSATIIGYALEAKTTSGSGGNTWLWYEGFSPKFIDYYGQGLSTCTGCHSSGTDFVTSKP